MCTFDWKASHSYHCFLSFLSAAVDINSNPAAVSLIHIYEIPIIAEGLKIKYKDEKNGTEAELLK